jgi:hypothetical protein
MEGGADGHGGIIDRQLAGAFNRMTAGLRERADMAKFVSASTVETIRRHPDTVPPGGERWTMPGRGLRDGRPCLR